MKPVTPRATVVKTSLSGPSRYRNLRDRNNQLGELGTASAEQIAMTTWLERGPLRGDRLSLFARVALDQEESNHAKEADQNACPARDAFAK